MQERPKGAMKKIARARRKPVAQVDTVRLKKDIDSDMRKYRKFGQAREAEEQGAFSEEASAAEAAVKKRGMARVDSLHAARKRNH